MEDFIGITFLFLACLEFILLINAIIFSQKNSVNFIVFITISIFVAVSIIEFIISQFEINNSALLLLNFSLISFLPALSLLLVLKFWNHESKLKFFIFLPTIAFIYYFTLLSNSIKIIEYSYFYIIYFYPLRTELGIFYFVMNFSALLFLIVKLRDPSLGYKKRLNVVLVLSLCISVVIPILILLFYPSLNIYTESILNKFAFFYVLGLTYFSLKNKTEFLSVKVD